MLEMHVIVPKRLIAKGAPLEELAISALKQGARATGTINGVTTYVNINAYETGNYDELTIQNVSAIASLGGEVMGYVAYVEVSDLDQEVPDYVDIPSTDNEGELVVKTWKDWTNNITKIGDKYYVSTRVVNGGNSSEHYKHFLPGSILLNMVSDGFTLKSLAEYKNLQENEEEII